MVLVGALSLACGAEPKHVPLGPPLPAPTPAELAPETADRPPPNATFVNHGGLFMPEQMPSQAEALERLGLRIDPALLSDPLSDLLASIVNFGGC